MNGIFDPIRGQIAGIITQALDRFDQNHGLTLEFVFKNLGYPPQKDMGHLAFACFALAKSLKQAPPKIAAGLEKIINEQALLGDLAYQVKAFGPYLNVFYNFKTLAKKLEQQITDGSFFKQKLCTSTPKTMIEFSQPNTHKEIHVGHMRNLCLGDALIKLHRYSGFDIISSTFPGDVGAHVAKCLWYYKKHYVGDPPKENKGAFLGTMYTLGNSKLEDERGTPQENLNRAELTEILSQLEKKTGDYYDLWLLTREWSIELMHEVYAWAGTSFDQWYWESEVDSTSVKLVNKYYAEGLFVKSKGAIGIDLSEYDLGFCLLIKSDGNGLYATKDIELARRKFEEHKIEKSLYVVDQRQSLHFKQVFKVLELMGLKNANNCFHLAYDFVELPDGAMSSRKGNIVPLMDLVKQMENKIINDYLKQYCDDWTAEEVNHTAHIVAQGAIKYGMLRIDPNKKIVFDMQEWLRLDGESGPYIQYAHARICSLLRKFPLELEQADYAKLTKPSELNLLSEMSNFNHVVLAALENYRPSTLCTYLYELAKSFSSFYASCLIGKEPDLHLKHARLSLSQNCATILSNGLKLLGIEAPSRM